MRVAGIPFALTAALAVMAAPAPAFACEDHGQGGGSGVAPHHAKPAKPVAKPGVKPAAPAKPGAAAPKPGDCCASSDKKCAECTAEAKRMQQAGDKKCASCQAGGKQCADCAAAAKRMSQAGDHKMCAACKAGGKPCADCQAKGAAPAKTDDCCAPGAAQGHGAAMKGHGPAAGDKKEACCEAEGGAKGECCDAQNPHQMKMNGHKGMQIERRVVRGGHLMGGWMAKHPDAQAYKGPEVRYMPVMAPGTNQYVVYARNKHLQLNNWVALGGQTNYALQLGNTTGFGPWFVPYGGFLPKVGTNFGPLRADVGALLGLGGMFRTGTVGGVDSVLQARVMWVVEPRVELGWHGDDIGVGLVGTYNYNPNMSEFGGPSVGLRMTWKRMGM